MTTPNNPATIPAEKRPTNQTIPAEERPTTQTINAEASSTKPAKPSAPIVKDLEFNPPFTFSELCENIYVAVLQVAQQTPPFSSTGRGTIRITAKPRCDAANVWLTPDTKHPYLHSIVERNFKITPDGSHTIITNDGPVSTYGYSALKTATCMDLVRDRISMNSLSSLEPNADRDYTEDCGFALHYGSICVKLMYTKGSRATRAHNAFAEIYVCVSGGDQVDDARCAWEAIPLIERMFIDGKCDIYASEMPVYPFDGYLNGRRGIKHYVCTD